MKNLKSKQTPRSEAMAALREISLDSRRAYVQGDLDLDDILTSEISTAARWLLSEELHRSTSWSDDL